MAEPYLDPDMNPRQGNAKGVARVIYVNPDSEHPNGHFLDRRQGDDTWRLILQIVGAEDDRLNPDRVSALQEALKRALGAATMGEAVEKLDDLRVVERSLRDQAVFCGGNHYGFEIFGGEAVRRRGEYAYISEPTQRLQRFLAGMESLNIINGYDLGSLMKVWEEFTRRNTDLFDVDTTSTEAQGWYLRFSAAANRQNGAGVSGEPLHATIAGEAWVWPEPLNLVMAKPMFSTVGVNVIGPHETIGQRFKYTSQYQHRVATRTAHKREHGLNEQGRYVVTDVMHLMPDGLPADLTAQNVFMLYTHGTRKRALFPAGPFFLGATRTSLMALFKNDGYEVYEPTTLDDASAMTDIPRGGAYPGISLLKGADFVGACGTTYAVNGIGALYFPGGGKIELNKDHFPREQVERYFRACIGLENVQGVSVHKFPLER